jgi:hypothetical protein
MRDTNPARKSLVGCKGLAVYAYQQLRTSLLKFLRSGQVCVSVRPWPAQTGAAVGQGDSYQFHLRCQRQETTIPNATSTITTQTSPTSPTAAISISAGQYPCPCGGAGRR